MKIVIPLGVFVSCLAFGGSARSQNFAINWFTIDGGGGTSTGGVFSVSGTIGQPDAGPMSGGVYSLVGGFWSGISLIQTPGAPLLSITNMGAVAVVSWPLPAAGFVLDRTLALTAPPAVISWNLVPASQYQTNATSIFVPVQLSGEKQFFRLRQP